MNLSNSFLAVLPTFQLSTGLLRISLPYPIMSKYHDTFLNLPAATRWSISQLSRG